MTWIAFDTETYLIQDGLLAPKMVCLSWSDGEDADVVLADDGCALLHEWLDDPSVCLVGHQVDYDVAVCMNHDHTLVPKFFDALSEGRVHDTKLRERIINLAFGDLDFKYYDGQNRRLRYSLAEFVYLYFGEDISASKKGEDIWRLRYNELDGVSVDRWPDDAYEYARDDAMWTWQVHQVQCQSRETDIGPIAGSQIKQEFDHETVQNEVRQVQASVALHLMSCWGLRTDPDHVAKFEEELDSDIETLEEGDPRAKEKEKRRGLVKTGILKWDTKKKRHKKDTKVLKQYVSEAYDGEPPTTEKGNVKTDKDTIEAASSPMLKLYTEWNHLNHIKNTYIPVLVRGTTVPINPRYESLRETGRTSSWRPNIQNQPRDGLVRTSYVPRPGHVYISIDYDTFELRSFAQVSLDMFGWSDMADALNAGHDDLHLEIACEMLGCSYEYAVEAYYEKKHGPEEYKRVHGARRLAKVLNFGRPGGLVPKSFPPYASNFGVEDVTVELAEELWTISDARWRELPLYLDTIANMCGFAGEFTLRMHWTNLQRGRTYYTSAANCPWQALAAAGAKNAGFMLSRECYTDQRSPLWNCRPVAFIHDEFLIEAPEDRAADAAWRATDILIEGAKEAMPDVPIQATPALMDRWYKDAEAVYTDDGTLSVWQPEEKAA